MHVLPAVQPVVQQHPHAVVKEPFSPAAARNRRVIVLIVGVLVLSIADLLVTITHLRTIGMDEANPIAAYLIRATGSSVALASFKFLTVGICVALLYHLRMKVQGEIAAWLALIILTGMSVVWHRYGKAIECPTELQLVQSHAEDRWLFLE